jgi:hypothetical protein
MNGLKRDLKQRHKRLCTIRGVMRSACWIKISDRKPTEDGSYVCLNDKGDYTIFDFRVDTGFTEWIIAWLEEYYA